MRQQVGLLPTKLSGWYSGRTFDKGMGRGNKVVCTPLTAWLVELLMRGWGVATRWSVPPSLPGW